MNKIEIYTGNFCGFCTAAKRLLNKKGANFSEINIHDNVEKRAEMIQRSNGGHNLYKHLNYPPIHGEITLLHTLCI